MIHSITVGDFEITHVSAGTYWWDAGAIFGVVPKALWSKQIAPDDLNRIPLALNCYVIRNGDHTILVETGAGDKVDLRFRERARLPAQPEPLPAILSRHEIDPDSVDIVVNSHLHWDHCSGNTIVASDPARSTAALPQARYFASRGEWEHAHERLIRDSVSYIDANYDPLVVSGQMTLVDADYTVIPGVRMRHAPGHTRDMAVVTVSSGGENFCFFSDLAPTAAHVQPAWVAAFDLYPLETIETKLRWLSDAAAGNWWCAFAHEIALPFAQIAFDEKTRFRALPLALR